MELTLENADWSKYHNHFECPGAKALAAHFNTDMVCFGEGECFVIQNNTMTFYKIVNFQPFTTHTFSIIPLKVTSLTDEKIKIYWHERTIFCNSRINY